MPRRLRVEYQPWTEQPPPGTVLDAGAVGSLGLIYVLDGYGQAAAGINGGSPIKSGTVTTVTNRAAAGTLFPSGSDNKIRIGDPNKLYPPGSDCTIAIVRRCTDTVNRNTGLFGFEQLGGPRILAHAPLADGTLHWDFQNDSTGRVSVAYTKDLLLETLVFVAGGGKGREVWRRGVRIAKNANSAANTTTALGDFYIGACNASGLRNSDGVEIYLAVLANKAWSDADIVRWAANPWQLYTPRRIIIPVSAVGGGSGIVSIGQALETDAAQAMLARQARALGQASETSAAQSLIARQSRALGIAAETSTAQSVGLRQSGQFGLLVESDAAQSLSASLPGGIAPATEANTAQALTTLQRRALGLVSEADTAQALRTVQARVIAAASEVGAAQPIGARQTRQQGQVAETDAAQPVTAGSGLLVALGLVLEIDTALPVSARRQLGQATEVDAAPALASAPAATSDTADNFDYALLLRVPGWPPPRLARMAQHLQMLRDTRLRAPRKR